jgi:hypothetical protein
MVVKIICPNNTKKHPIYKIYIIKIESKFLLYLKRFLKDIIPFKRISII